MKDCALYAVAACGHVTKWGQSNRPPAGVVRASATHRHQWPQTCSLPWFRLLETRWLWKESSTAMLILLIVLLLVFGAGGGYYGHRRWGSGGGTGIGLGTVLVILLIAYMLGFLG